MLTSPAEKEPTLCSVKTESLNISIWSWNQFGYIKPCEKHFYNYQGEADPRAVENHLSPILIYYN